MRLVKVVVLAAVVLLIVPQVVSAQESKNTVRLSAEYISPTGDFTGVILLDDLEAEAKLQADEALGAEVGYEYRYSDLLGLEANLAYTKHDIRLSALGVDEKVGDVTFMPLLFGANFHLFRGKKVDFYVGPTLGLAMFGDINQTGAASGPSIKTKDKFTWGGALGLDVPFGSHWAFTAGAKYLVLDAETDAAEVLGENIKLGFDPWIVRAGIAYRF